MPATAVENPSAIAPPPASAAARRALILVLLLAGLWLAHLYLRVLPDPAVLALWAAAAALIARGGFRRHRLRRAAFLRGYLDPASGWNRRLRGGPPMALRHLLTGALLAAILLPALARLQDPRVWSILLAGALALVLLEALLARAMHGHAHPRFAPELARRGALLLVGLPLTAALLWLALQGEYPDLTGATLEQAVWHLVEQQSARSGLLETGLQLAAAQDGLRLWLGQQWLPEGARSLPALFGWLLVLAEQAFLAAGFLLLANGLIPPRPGDPADDRTPSASA